MAKVPGMFSQGEIEKVKLGMDNQRLSSLLSAILHHTGPVHLTKEEVEREWPSATLQYAKQADGGIIFSLIE